MKNWHLIVLVMGFLGLLFVGLWFATVRAHPRYVCFLCTDLERALQNEDDWTVTSRNGVRGTKTGLYVSADGDVCRWWNEDGAGVVLSDAFEPHERERLGKAVQELIRQKQREAVRAALHKR